MMKYAVPCIISLLVAALYNIVDQIFIANATYLGSYGNAANTVVFPLTVVALAIAVMIGDGACTFVSISLGAGKKEEAHKSIGSAVVLCVILSLIVTAVYLIFANGILTAFGGRVNEETFQQAQSYFFWITVGMPFYMFGQAMNPVIRADGDPKFAMASTLLGAFINIFGAANESVYYTEFALRAFRVYLCMVVLACVNKACFIFLQAMGKAAESTAISMIREIVFGVGFALLLPVFFGLDGVLYSMPVSDLLTFLIAAVLIVRTFLELGAGEDHADAKSRKNDENSPAEHSRILQEAEKPLSQRLSL